MAASEEGVVANFEASDDGKTRHDELVWESCIHPSFYKDLGENIIALGTTFEPGPIPQSILDRMPNLQTIIYCIGREELVKRSLLKPGVDLTTHAKLHLPWLEVVKTVDKNDRKQARKLAKAIVHDKDSRHQFHVDTQKLI